MLIKVITAFAAIGMLFFTVSCESITAGAGVPIPFTNPDGAPTKVGLDISVNVMPPKFCIGLGIKE